MLRATAHDPLTVDLFGVTLYPFTINVHECAALATSLQWSIAS